LFSNRYHDLNHGRLLIIPRMLDCTQEFDDLFRDLKALMECRWTAVLNLNFDDSAFNISSSPPLSAGHPKRYKRKKVLTIITITTITVL